MPTWCRPPNVLLIIMDDLCWGDLKCHGNPVIRTPHLDNLHDSGVSLQRYCTGPLCSPARASLLAGRYHLRTRVVDTYCGRSMIDPDEPTIARSLSSAGYATGAFGKWHLGDCHPMRAMDMGFDETLQHRGGGIGQPGDHPDNHARESECYFDPVLYRNGIPEKSQGYCTDIFADATIDFIARHRQAPFFAYLATNAPHTPLIVADRWSDPYRHMGINDTHARLYGMVENIDMNVGRVLATLDELGLAEDTIVIYTSDHGPCGSARDPDAPVGRQDRYNAGLRGIKGQLFEGGIRAPCFWRWPGKIPVAIKIDRITHPIDVLPTLLAACSVGLPQGPVIDGCNLLPLLTGETAPGQWPDRALFMQWHRGDVPVKYRNYAVITQRHKLHRQDDDFPDELYDLVADPFEQHDLAAEQPGLVATMRHDYEDWLCDMAATRGNGTFDPPLIHLGTPAENLTLLSTNDWRLHHDEGWRRDDLRGHWETMIVAADEYAVTIRFKPDIPAGTVFFRAEDVIVSRHADAGETVIAFPAVRLPACPARLEAWRELDHPCKRARHRRFIPALYVEVARPHG